MDTRTLLVAVVIGFVVRLLKHDTAFPVTLPRWTYPFVALILGGLDVTARSILAGETLKASFHRGMSAAVLAMLGHDIIVSGLRQGKDIHVPGITGRVSSEDDSKKEP